MVKSSRPKVERYLVQVMTGDKTPQFVDVTRDLGKSCPFAKPLATCAIRVVDDAVLFSVMKLHTRSRKTVVEKPLSLPHGPLVRLAESAEKLGMPQENTVVAVYEDQTFVFDVSRDDSGIVSLEVRGEDMVFELPKRIMMVNFYLPGPRGKVLAVSWAGFQNKPGSPETITRAVAFAMNHLTGVPDFAVLSQISKVKVDAPPGRYAPARTALRPGVEVSFQTPVRLWTGDASPTLVAAGVVSSTVDLETASASAGRLAFHHTPSEELVEAFEAYRMVFDQAVHNEITSLMGPDEVLGIVCDISLGEVSDGTVERLQKTTAQLPGLDLNPVRYVPIKGA